MAHKAVFFNLEPFAKDYILKSGLLARCGVEAVFADEALDKDHIPADKNFDVAGIFVDSVVDKKTLDALPNLKFLATFSTGYDHVDLTECRKRGIVVSYVPSYGENTVAEFTFALLLDLSRKICFANDRVRKTGSFSEEGLRGFDLQGKTLGVIGTGHIGRNVVRIAKGFEMNVVAFDIYPDEKFAAKAGFKYLPLADLLKESDIITLHVPYMKETHHLINAETIEKMKQGAYLINTSRGGVVETSALLKALRSGRLGGVALDVLEEEGAVKDELNLLVDGRHEEHDLKTILENHVLMKMPNVIITPHNAFNSNEAFARILDTTIENIAAYAGGKPANLVP